MDLELPEDEVIDGYSGYSSRWFTLGSQHVWPSAWWWKVLFLRLATPERPYFIAFFPRLSRELCNFFHMGTRSPNSITN